MGIKFIDPRGTMMDGVPYAEILMPDGRFFLEEIGEGAANIEFYLLDEST